VTTAISTELNNEPLLLKIMQATTEILDADRSTLFMHDPKAKELWSLVAQGAGSSRFRFPATAGIAGSVFTSGQTVNIPDA
jgi:adenylate cyclase